MQAGFLPEKIDLLHIWVDADACPKAIKAILYRASQRLEVELTLVANASLHIPRSPWIKNIVVKKGADVADQEIVSRLSTGDLVITADIPLAAEVIGKGGHALNPRGTLYNKDNVQQSLAMRNFLDNLRGSGVITGGPPVFGKGDCMAFANALDRFLTRYVH
ncbi:MAG: YaiI/YqxD family protein [Mariprofundaceae bacterium]|nr:YaiI/YqxD family protein [Mariprofundaceae bacterium]